MRKLLLSTALFLAACTMEDPGTSSGPAAQSQPTVTRSVPAPDARRFNRVVGVMEPVAEAICAAQTRNTNCDFKIVVDTSDPNAPPNAFQTLERSGRPVLVFTPALLETVRNDHELAFVLGHEAAHHIAGHLPKTQNNAILGALIFGAAAAIAGAGDAGLRTAQDIGSTVGARSYSKEFELEADRLGTIITARAGYDPVLGAAYFSEIPDPGNRFLGTHPPNAARIATVRKTAASL